MTTHWNDCSQWRQDYKAQTDVQTEHPYNKSQTGAPIKNWKVKSGHVLNEQLAMKHCTRSKSALYKKTLKSTPSKNTKNGPHTYFNNETQSEETKILKEVLRRKSQYL